MAELTVTKITLLLLSAFGAYCIIGLQIRNGFFQLLDTAGREIPRKLPGSSENILTKFTGFPDFDSHVGGVLMFFWPVVSAESPPLSLFGFYMAGQLLAVETLVLLEGLRAANMGKIISYTTILGIMYQSVPWGITMPLYLALYLWTSPIVQAIPSKSNKESAKSLTMDPMELVVLPIALSLGYIIPTTLSAIPIVITAAQQQSLLLFWQGFPIWIAISQYSLSTILSVSRSSSSNTKPSQAIMVKLLRRVYTFSLSLAALIHIMTIVFAVVPTSRPEYLFPASRPTVDLRTVFLPMSPFSTTNVELLAQGCLILLQYDMYFACAATIIWAAVMFKRTHPKSTFWGSVTKELFLSLLVGPGGAALVLIWERDEKVFKVEKDAEKKAGKAS